MVAIESETIDVAVILAKITGGVEGLYFLYSTALTIAISSKVKWHRTQIKPVSIRILFVEIILSQKEVYSGYCVSIFAVSHTAGKLRSISTLSVLI
jgi:hypothetical protein